jgi:hypothetical protein
LPRSYYVRNEGTDAATWRRDIAGSQYYAHEAITGLGLLGIRYPEHGTLPQGYEHVQWLADWDAADKGKRGGVKYSILAELGRLLQVADHDFVLRTADCVSKGKLRTKEAVTYLRQLRRNGTAPPPDGAVLLDRLAQCVDQYRSEHPGMSIATTLDVIDNLYRAVANLAPQDGSNTND